MCYIVLTSQVWKNKQGVKVQMTSCQYMNDVATGLVFCSLGDWLLHLEDHPTIGHDFWFLGGLVSFLIGHIFFMFALSKKSYKLEKFGIKQKDDTERIVIIFFVVGMIGLLVPNINDNVLKIGVCVYAFVIGRMALWSLILNNQESRLNDTLKSELNKLSKQEINSDKGLYYIYVTEQLKGSFSNIQNYVIASFFFVISDSILAYAKFVEKGEKGERQKLVLITYFTSLFFFMLSAIQS